MISHTRGPRGAAFRPVGADLLCPRPPRGPVRAAARQITAPPRLGQPEKSAKHHQVLPTGQHVVDGHLRPVTADRLTHLAGSATTSWPATLASPTSGQGQRREDVDRRRLAGAVGPPEDRPPHRQRRWLMSRSGDVPVRLADSPNDDAVVGHRSTARSGGRSTPAFRARR